MTVQHLLRAWLVLLALTAGALALTLAAGDALARGTQAGLLVAIGGVKAWIILAHFAGINRRAGGWRILFVLYLAILCGLVLAVYAAGCAHHGLQCFSSP
jgi:heme/copper-type cytochrome/quinol oxidase subunit 4